MGTAGGIGIGIGIGIVIGIALMFVAFAGMGQNTPVLENIPALSIEELRAMEVSFDYKDILRNPQKYEGKIIHFTAKVFKVQQKFGDNYQLEVQTDCPDPDWRCGNFVVDYTGSRILHSDIVVFYVQVDYVDNYTILGSTIPVPYVTAIRVT